MNIINGNKKPSSQNKMWTTIGPPQQPQQLFLVFVALQCMHKIFQHLHSTTLEIMRWELLGFDLQSGFYFVCVENHRVLIITSQNLELKS
jgi:hypothetical protein